MSIFDKVRAACSEVASRASQVTIRRERIPAYAASLPLDDLAAPALDPASHYLDRGDDTVAFILTLNSINFGSGYFPHLRKQPGRSGYFTMATALTEHFREHGPFSASDLTRLDVGRCTAIFGQDRTNPVAAELMALFATALGDLGRYLQVRFAGSFTAPVEAARGSAERLVGILREMPFFDDVQDYDGLEVPFYKRAQITAADLSLAFGGDGPGRFEDLDRLTIFADNLVPHVLRLDGILDYDPELARRIDAGELIPRGSQEEIEIRAGAVHAVELMCRELRARSLPVTAMKLDYLLWNRGQQPFYKQTKPRHRTRTVYY